MQLTDDTRAWIPIGVSMLSLLIAGCALGWNVYRDVILRARVRVRFAVVTAVIPGVGTRGSYLNISVVNFGPGPVQIQGICGLMSPWWKTLLRRPEHFFVLNDQTNPMNPRLPARLEVGETLNFYLPHDDRSLLSAGATHVGVSDSFGRQHFAPRGHVRVAREVYARDFGGGKPKVPPAH